MSTNTYPEENGKQEFATCTVGAVVEDETRLTVNQSDATAMPGGRENLGGTGTDPADDAEAGRETAPSPGRPGGPAQDDGVKDAGKADGASDAPGGAHLLSMTCREKRRAREARLSAEFGDGEDEDDDDDGGVCDSSTAPGAFPVPGFIAADVATVPIVVQDRQYPEGVNRDVEHVVDAKLVDDIEVDEREQRERILQELLQEAESAEIVDVKGRRRRGYMLACVCILLLAGIITAVVVTDRPDQDEETVDNSSCPQSLQLELGVPVTGNVGTAAQNSTKTCGPTLAEVSQGRWYYFQGDGSMVTISTCLNTNSDPQISVFTGSSCDALSCVAFNDGNPNACCTAGHTDCSSGSSVTLLTTERVDYYIFVHGTGIDQDSAFELTVSQTPSTAQTSTTCENAVVVCPFFEGFIRGSTELAAINATLDKCGSISDNGAGVWYQVRASEGFLTASTCDSLGSLDDTQISVFEGHHCGSLQCVGGSDDSCGGTRSSVPWGSSQESTYYVYVHGRGNETGTFDMKIQRASDRDEIADNCLTATSDLKSEGINTELIDVIDKAMEFYEDMDLFTFCSFSEDDTVGNCEFDLGAVENTVLPLCDRLGGRSILFNFTYPIFVEAPTINAKDVTLFVNYLDVPDCVSISCPDSLIQSNLELAQSYFGIDPNDTTCEGSKNITWKYV